MDSAHIRRKQDLLTLREMPLLIPAAICADISSKLRVTSAFTSSSLLVSSDNTSANFAGSSRTT